MNTIPTPALLTAALLLHFAAAGAGPPAERPATPAFDLAAAKAEVNAHYAAAHPEVQEYVLWTARTFSGSGLWLPEDAFAALTPDARERRVQYLATLFSDSEYGRHLCTALAEASALKDERLVPGLLKVAAYHQPDRDYDCRPKWQAVAALARQESNAAVPVLVGLVDHGNQNTRFWARAALARKTGQDFKSDKPAWADWWRNQGHDPIPENLVQPWAAPKPEPK